MDPSGPSETILRGKIEGNAAGGNELGCPETLMLIVDHQQHDRVNLLFINDVIEIDRVSYPPSYPLLLWGLGVVARGDGNPPATGSSPRRADAIEGRDAGGSRG